jgi:hypothetical protein
VSFTASTSAPPQAVMCTTDSECALSENCVGGVCTAKPGTSGGTSGSTSGGTNGGTSGGTSGGSSGATSSGTSGGTNGGTGLAVVPNGAPCTDSSQCLSGICAESGGQHFCTVQCDPQLASSCPSTMSCVDTGGKHLRQDFYCQLADGGSSSGCSATGRTPHRSALGLGLLLVAALTGLRRARVRVRSHG